MHLVVTRTRTIILFLVMMLFISCSLEKHQRMLSFFFDGVPDPNSSEQMAEEQIVKDGNATEDQLVERKQKASQPEFLSVHPPYKDRECDSCHERSSASFLTISADELCFLCHDSEPFEGTYVHGPVAVAACTACHQPHQSKEPYLLLKPVVELCLDCHDETDVFRNENHEDVDRCVDCHNPHAGEDPAFMW